MKNNFFFLSAIALAAIANQADAASCYNAEACTGSPNVMKGYSAPYANQESSGQTKVLQTSSTEKFVGTIKSVNRANLPNQSQIQVVLSTDQGDVLVIVGPASFVDQSITLQPGDKITVSGYNIKANGNQVVLAAKIEKNGYSVQLLDDNRNPVWLNGQKQQGSTSTQSFSSQFYGQRFNSYSGPNSYLQNTNPSSSYSGTQNPKMPNSRY